MNETKKSNSVVTVERAGTVLIYTVLGVGQLRLDRASMHPDNIAAAVLHGMEQRIRDAGAIARDKETGASATPQQKYDAMQQLVEHYSSGSPDWTLKRAEGAGGAKSITIEAIARVKQCDYQTAEDMVNRLAASKYANDRKVALRQLANTPSVQAAILAIRAERMPTPKADGDSLLSELG
jgi:hypothetical protein